MSVRVVARVRPLLPSERESDTILITNASPENASVRIPNPRNESESYSFHFHSIYAAESSQSCLYDAEIAPTIKSLFRGIDVTLFAYGVTGTGKTWTMKGGKSLANRGVIPRLLSGVFRRAKKIEKDTQGQTTVGVSLSYYEIYCDRVYDLFEPAEKRTLAGLPIRDNGGKTIVVGLTERPCGTLKEFEAMYDAANIHRSTGSTKLNAHSSRSHAILSVKLTQTTSEHIQTSTISAIDLAGSEDNRRTENGKDRMIESAAINKSLFVLAQCVEAISKKQARVPYRESRMTRILSLGQNAGVTIMILNLAPVRSYHLDTLSSLNFANRTKKIEVNEVENRPVAICPSKTDASGGAVMAVASMQRQPLRPKHFSTNVVPKDLTDKVQKPAKSFNVYAESAIAHHVPFKAAARSTAKRASSENQSSLTLAKKQRSAGGMTELTAESIEALIDRKVAEKLASAVIETKSAPQETQTLSCEVQARLDALEKRVDGQQADSEGLQFLLMGKQHQVRKEWSRALRCYQLAVPHFPGNEKLEKKILAMQQKLSATKREVECSNKPMGRSRESLEDASFHAIHEDEEDDADDSFESSSTNTGAAKKRVRSGKSAASSLTGDSPRSKELLRILNSRDVNQIKMLKGVGVKKAEALVEGLLAEGQLMLESFEDLERFKGVGLKGLERMRDGIVGIC